MLKRHREHPDSSFMILIRVVQFLQVLTYDWSIPMLGPHAKGLVLPGNQMHLKSGVSAQGRKLFTFRQLLSANYDRYATFGVVLLLCVSQFVHVFI